MVIGTMRKQSRALGGGWQFTGGGWSSHPETGTDGRFGLLLDCGSLLPLSSPQPAVDNHLQFEHRGHKATRTSGPNRPCVG